MLARQSNDTEIFFKVPNLAVLSTQNWVSEHRKFLQAETQVGRSLLQSEQIRHLLRAHRDWSYSECLQVVQTYQLSLSVTTGDLILGALVLPAGLSKSEWCPSSSSWRQKVLFTLGRAQKTQVNCILGKAGSSGSKYSPVVLIWFERQRSLFISIYLSSVVLIIHLGWGFSSQKTNNLSRLLSSNHETASVQCVDKPGPLCILGQCEASSQQERDLKGATVNRVHWKGKRGPLVTSLNYSFPHFSSWWEHGTPALWPYTPYCCVKVSSSEGNKGETAYLTAYLFWLVISWKIGTLFMFTAISAGVCVIIQSGLKGDKHY